MRAEATWIAADQIDLAGVMIYDSGFTDDASGALISFDEAARRFPGVFGIEGSGQPPGMTPVYLMTPPELYPAFVVREMGAALALVIVLVGRLALWVVRWRRPD